MRSGTTSRNRGKNCFATGYGKATAYKQKSLQSSNIWTVALEDDEGVQTRLNELPTLSLVLCRRLSKTDAEFIDGSQAVLGGEEFRLATAQAIHRNLVKLPLTPFCASERIASEGAPRHCPLPARAQSVGMVDHDRGGQGRGIAKRCPAVLVERSGYNHR